MSSQRKKARLSSKTSIDSLPDEVMCLIFDRMDYYDVKDASLTCHRWNNIIFMSNYVLRFNLKISAKNMHAVSKSKRRYRCIKWDIPDQDALSIWDTIYPNITDNLHSLVISCGKQQPMASTLALMLSAIPLMTQLRSLALIDENRETPEQDITPTLRSNFISSLKFVSNFKIRVDMPELQTFEGNWFALTTPEDQVQPNTLAKLKELNVHRNNTHCYSSTFDMQISITAAKSILQRLTNIEKMKLDISVEDDLFNAICEICTTLKELDFEHEMNHYNVANVAKLNNLKQLCKLRLWAIRIDGTGYTSSIFDWSKLAFVEDVELGYEVQDTLKLPKSVKKLKVCMDSFNEECMIKTIINCAAYLKELRVVISDRNGNGTDYDEPIRLLKALSHLEHLEVLVFYYGLFLENSFIHTKAPLVRLRKLRFKWVQLQSSKTYSEIGEMSNPRIKFNRLKKKFPNLIEPEFSDCSVIPRYEPSDSCSSDSDDYYYNKHYYL